MATTAEVSAGKRQDSWTDIQRSQARWQSRRGLTAGSHWTAEEQAPRRQFDPVRPPADYEEMYRNYFGFVVGLVQKLGISSRQAEDVASEIFLRFMERDKLAQFEPEHRIEHEGQRYKARFQSFLSAYVVVSVRHHRDVENRQKIREPLIVDAPVGEGDSTWLDANTSRYASQPDEAPALVEDRELRDFVRRHLVSVGRRSRQDVMDLPRLWDHVLYRVDFWGAGSSTGKDARLDIEELRSHFINPRSGGPISSTAMHSWLGQLRVHVAAALKAYRDSVREVCTS
jgi:DNA-directed RNA polymerase specialized sigma24 family protein